MVTLEAIQDAQRRLRGIAARTPLIRYYTPAGKERLEAPETELYLKAENLQPIGAFKLRGAHIKIASFTDEESAAGRHHLLQRKPCSGCRLRRPRDGSKSSHRDAT